MFINMYFWNLVEEIVWIVFVIVWIIKKKKKVWLRLNGRLRLENIFMRVWLNYFECFFKNKIENVLRKIVVIMKEMVKKGYIIVFFILYKFI